jgi:hypothetical protein
MSWLRRHDLDDIQLIRQHLVPCAVCHGCGYACA